MKLLKNGEPLMSVVLKKHYVALNASWEAVITPDMRAKGLWGGGRLGITHLA
jgi:hypothetical protein